MRPQGSMSKITNAKYVNIYVHWAIILHSAHDLTNLMDLSIKT